MNIQSFIKKVMIIDDADIDRYIITHKLKKHFDIEEVVAVESARKALNYLTNLIDNPCELPQLILLDIRMPEIDGFGFLDEYNNLPDQVKKHCTIMMLSSSLDPKDHERAKNNPNVKEFLIKPLNIQLLKEIMMGNEFAAQ